MALFPKTPGVYVQEISTLPPSVVPVPTAIPVFIGYTQKAIIDGSQWDYSTKGATDPIRVESLVDYQTSFGGAYIQPYTANINDAGTSLTATFGEYALFTNLQMFYANGGGTCYIISVGSYSDPLSGTDILNAIARAEKVDEITLVVIPEATAASISGSFENLNNGMLDHCAKMQDRFAILDVKHTSTIANDASAFRNNGVGINNLSYGAAYYPPLNTTIVRPYSDIETVVSDTRTTPVFVDDSGSPSTGGPFNNLFTVKNGYAAWALITLTSSPSGNVIINGVQFTAGVDFISGTAAVSAESLKKAINNNNSLNTAIVAITAGLASGDVALIARNSVTLGAGYTITATGITVSSNTGVFWDIPSLPPSNQPDTALYNSFATLLNANLLTLYPSSTMAGIYTGIDNTRGVWKAPANVSLNLVSSPSVNITDADQSGLNVDSNAGKSIDAIRSFTGRGTLVWGARTLDGNSNDFSYVNVRRTLIFIEHSCKLASEFVVFEPNDKNTWLRVKSMIGNFLNNVWRDGGLVGDKPDQAYFVKVGLGETMTAQDILEGRLIVTIGLAISHPAEFIILNFEHMLQKS